MTTCIYCNADLSATRPPRRCPGCGQEVDAQNHSVDQTSFVSLIIACIVGFVAWRVAIAFSNGNPLGRVGAFDAFVFFTPAVGTLAPYAVRAMSRDRIDKAAWMAALAPFLGLANFLLVIGIAGTIGGRTNPLSKDQAVTVAAVVTSMLWMIPMIRIGLLPVYRNWKQARVSRP